MLVAFTASGQLVVVRLANGYALWSLWKERTNQIQDRLNMLTLPARPDFCCSCSKRSGTCTVKMVSSFIYPSISSLQQIEKKENRYLTVVLVSTV